MVSRRTVIAAGFGTATTLAVSGCNATGGNAAWREPGSGVLGEHEVKPSPTSTVRVITTPTAAAIDVSPVDPVVITAEGGTLQSVTVSSPEKPVAGTLATDQRTWRSSGSLEYGKTYTVTVTAMDPDGISAAHTSTFNTVQPTATTATSFYANASLVLRNGGTYGVGQPVIVNFTKGVKDHAAAEKIMEVVTEPHVEGRWHWFSNQSAHWRPASYWTPGTKITVNVNSFGTNLGGGVYGTANASIGFNIGPSRIAIADGKSHRMQVFINGAKVRDIPVSLGKEGSTKGADGSTIYFATNAGPHVVLGKEPVVRMTSASYGIKDPKDPNYYDEKIKLCTRISYSGEYVHYADWNVPQHGRANTSHGCINVGPDHAQWFYDTFQVGDVVEVKNTTRKLSPTDGLGDWVISWENW
jgi:lipoprotein-anchoring transpeptidase ErfK/SrfK